MHSDFFDVGIGVDVFVEFHFCGSEFLFQGSVLSQVENFVVVDELDCDEAEA